MVHRALFGCFLIFLLRIPSFFEPAWHTDEGSFAGVAEGILRGRDLYSEAWESKPPLFLYLYAGIFKVFGSGLLQLKVAAALAAILTQFAIYLVGTKLAGPVRGLAASVVFGVLVAVPFWEGNLALSEIFSMPAATLGVLAVLARSDRHRPNADAWLALAGVLFGLAFLLRQPAVLAMPAAALWLALDSRLTLSRLFSLAAGFALPIVVITAAFAVFGSFFWFWDANVAYFLYYVPNGSRITSTLMLYMFAPAAIALVTLFWLRMRGAPTPAWALPALWFALAFVGSLLNGKDYSHYLLQIFPPLALLFVTILPVSMPALRITWRQPALAVAVTFAVVWYVVVNAVFFDTWGRHWTKGMPYYSHFFNYVTGQESRSAYNAYFDGRVNTTAVLDDQFEALRAEGATAYIWGEYPWVYALSGLQPYSRYVTSYYILESEERLDELLAELAKNPPQYLIIGADAEPRPNRTPTKERFNRVAERLRVMTAQQYEPVATAGKATVFELISVNTADKQPR